MASTTSSMMQLGYAIRKVREAVMSDLQFTLPLEHMIGHETLREIKMNYRRNVSAAITNILQKVLTNKMTSDEALVELAHITNIIANTQSAPSPEIR